MLERVTKGLVGGRVTEHLIVSPSQESGPVFMSAQETQVLGYRSTILV